jgi:hypothetical protein
MTPSRTPYWSTATLGVLCFGMWLAILAATLWPFNPFPQNEVRWLSQTNGVHIGKGGIVSSSAPLSAESVDNTHACSLEVLLRPENDTEVHTFLSFYAPGDFLPLELRQYSTGLLIFRRNRVAHDRISGAEIDVDHVFQRGKTTLITVASGAHGTRVYLDGVLAQSAVGFHISSGNCSGELLLGSAPITYDAWSGDIRGLAFFGRELSAAQVQQHFTEWTQTGRLPADTTENPRAEYFFAEGAGTVAHGQASSQPDLLIPKHYQVPHKGILTPPWKEITPLWIYVDDLARNVVGFVPLGMLFYVYFLRMRPKRRAIAITILLGGLSSLGIEFLQAFIPQRVSGMTDIITNTLGTALGVVLLQPRAIRVMLESWGVFQAVRDPHE